jgi:hypothetical protein
MGAENKSLDHVMGAATTVCGNSKVRSGEWKRLDGDETGGRFLVMGATIGDDRHDIKE